MAAVTEQEVELDLRGGLITNGSLYEIGPRFQSTQNAVYGWRYPLIDPSLAPDRLPPNQLILPTYFPPRTAIAYGSTPSRFWDIGFTGHDTLGRTKVIVGTLPTTGMRLWEAETGLIIALHVSAGESFLPLSSEPTLGTSTYWSTPGAGAKITGGAFFFTHPGISRIYYLLDTSTASGAIRCMNDDGITNTPAGASSICVHTDRLWMAKNEGTYGLSRLWFSDPFDAETIRGTSFVTIDDFTNVIMPTVPGNIDGSGLPHLFVGGANSIWIIDGDPSSLQGLRRQIKQGIGVPGVNAAVNTEYGVFFLGTDYQIYLCSTDGREIIPVGDAIRPSIGIDVTTGSTKGKQASLAWFPPYLYYFPRDQVTCYIADMTNPSKPIWWGSVNTTINAGGFPIIKGTNTGSTLHTPNGSPSPAVYMAGILSFGNGYYGGFDRYTKVLGTYPHGHETTRQQILTTGYIHKEGHDVKIRRIVLETKTKADAYTWTIRAINERGTSTTAVRVSPGAVALSTTGAVTSKHFYAFSNQRPAVGKAVQLSISGPTTSQDPGSNGMDLLKVRAVIEFTKANE